MDAIAEAILRLIDEHNIDSMQFMRSKGEGVKCTIVQKIH